MSDKKPTTVQAALAANISVPALGEGSHISLIPTQAEMVFEDAEPIQIPVRIGSDRYILQEASEDAARRYKNAGMRAARLTDGKVTGVEGIADAESILLHLCMVRVNTKRDNGKEVDTYEPVTIQEVLSWKHRITSQLFKKCVEISALAEPETVQTLRARITADRTKLEKLEAAGQDREEPGKNSPNGMPVTSSSPSN